MCDFRSAYGVIMYSFHFQAGYAHAVRDIKAVNALSALLSNLTYPHGKALPGPSRSIKPISDQVWKESLIGDDLCHIL
jgi:hypothetical protein